MVREVRVVRVVFRKKLIVPLPPNLTHYLTLPLAAAKKGLKGVGRLNDQNTFSQLFCGTHFEREGTPRGESGYL